MKNTNTNANTNTSTAKANAASIKPIIAEFESIFAKANKQLYGGKLSQPVITINTDVTKGAYGWCTSKPVWVDANKQHDGDARADYFEICITAENLARPADQLVETLLHEMVHLWNSQNGVKDTSRNGYFHNSNYKDACKGHGLACAENDKYGWCDTSLDDGGKKLLSSVRQEAFHLARLAPAKREKVKSTTHSIKYVCPVCGASVRSTKSVSVACMHADTDYAGLSAAVMVAAGSED